MNEDPLMNHLVNRAVDAYVQIEVLKKENRRIRNLIWETGDEKLIRALVDAYEGEET